LAVRVYGYNLANAGTLFAEGVPPTGVGRAAVKSGLALARLAERLGRPPVFRDPAAPDTIRLLLDHALQAWRARDLHVLPLRGATGCLPTSGTAA
jgi:non-heme chloroperoxidase